MTKRSKQLLTLNEQINWPDNVWKGVTVKNEDVRNRIDDLRRCGARVKFLSLEPLLSLLPNLNLDGMGWVIVGGESGPGARPVMEEWVIDLRDQCNRMSVPFFFKQWGGARKKIKGRLLEGRLWSEMPVFA